MEIDMSTLTLDVYTSPQRELPGGVPFSPTTATLVLEPTETVRLPHSREKHTFATGMDS